MTQENKNVTTTKKRQFTVTEIAKMIGISRSTVYQRAEKNGVKLGGELTEEELETLGVTNDVLERHTYKKDDTDLLQELQSEVERLRSENVSIKTNNDILNNSNVTLTRELDAKNAQIEKHQTALEHEQALHLSAIRQLEQAKDELKALESGEQETESQSDVKIKPKKHWWQF